MGSSSRSRGRAMKMLLDDEQAEDELHQIKINMEIEEAQRLQAYYYNQPKHGGSVVGRVYRDREREKHHEDLMKDYFIERNTFGPTAFRRRFRMNKPLFYLILNEVAINEPYFVQKMDATRRPGLSPEQKLTSVFRMLAYGCSADSTDEYTKLAESTAIETLRYFCSTVVRIYKDQYLRQPTQADLHRLLRKGSHRGFPGMLGSLDCMHWQWKNCPIAWAGQFTGHKGKPTVVLETVASYDTWIWHAYFGTAGSNNDINTLAMSPLFTPVVHGIAPQIRYRVNNHEYSMGYYLVDGIYPKWSTFVKTISRPDSEQTKFFSKKQEAYRKDVERAFGILQARWGIIKGPARMWCKSILGDIMLTCIILHNMIVEDEYEEYEAESDDEDGFPRRSSRVTPSDYDLHESVCYEYAQHRPTIAEYMARHRRIRSVDFHDNLRKDLVVHLWRAKLNAELV